MASGPPKLKPSRQNVIPWYLISLVRKNYFFSPANNNEKKRMVEKHGPGEFFIQKGLGSHWKCFQLTVYSGASQLAVAVPRRDMWPCLETSLLSQLARALLESSGARDVAEHPQTHRTAPPTRKNYPGQIVNSAAVENPALEP